MQSNFGYRYRAYRRGCWLGVSVTESDRGTGSVEVLHFDEQPLSVQFYGAIKDLREIEKYVTSLVAKGI